MSEFLIYKATAKKEFFFFFKAEFQILKAVPSYCPFLAISGGNEYYREDG